MTSQPTAPASPLVSAADLLAELAETPADQRPTLLDVRWTLSVNAGQAADSHETYLAGHLPGAVWVDLETALAAPHQPGVTGRHPLPPVEVFEAAMRAAGVCEDRPVLVYDAGNALAASRCWWMLGWCGKRDVRVLDGGYAAWVAAGGASEEGEVVASPGDFTARPDAAQVVERADVAALGEQGVLVDGRPADRFRGEHETIDPVAGHVPGAVSVPALLSLTPEQTFLPAGALAERFELVPDGTSPVLMCGSGVQAAHLALAWQAAGRTEPVRLYAGSWSDYITDPSRPVATGE